jgi:regulatory protein
MKNYEIVRIEKLKKKDFKITLDDDSELVVHEDLLVKHHLYKDKNISNEEWVALVKEAESQGIVKSAFRLISFRTRTAKELRLKLIEKGFNDEAIAGIIEKLILDGYINHKEYAEQFVRDAIQLKKKGLKWVRFELAHRGIEQTIIDEAISRVDHSFEIEQMRSLADRKWAQYVRKYGNTYETKLRMRHFLETKGCTNSTIQSLMNELDN